MAKARKRELVTMARIVMMADLLAMGWKVAHAVNISLTSVRIHKKSDYKQPLRRHCWTSQQWHPALEARKPLFPHRDGAALYGGQGLVGDARMVALFPREARCRPTRSVGARRGAVLS